ncbi:MAG: hypothetical protein ABSF46_01480 [Terriglobia bacterium]
MCVGPRPLLAIRTVLISVSGMLQQSSPPLLTGGGSQGLIWHSSTIASKRDLGHFESMEENDSPTLFVWLALRAALYGAGLIAIYTAIARVIVWFGLAPK